MKIWIVPFVASLSMTLCAATSAFAGFKLVPVAAGSRVSVSGQGIDVRVVGTKGAELRVETSDGEPRVEVNGPEISVSANDSDLVLRVPAGVSVTVRTMSGDVRAEGTGGELKLHSVSGSLSVRGAAGSVDLSAVGGNVSVHDAKAGVIARSVSGDVEVRSSSGVVRARSISGKVSARNVTGTRVRLQSHSGNVVMDGTIARDGSLVARSFSGNVDVALAQSDYSLRASTRSGRVEVGPVIRASERSESSVRGTVGKGGPEVRLSSFSGDVSVKVK